MKRNDGVDGGVLKTPREAVIGSVSEVSLVLNAQVKTMKLGEPLMLDTIAQPLVKHVLQGHVVLVNFEAFTE